MKNEQKNLPKKLEYKKKIDGHNKTYTCILHIKKKNNKIFIKSKHKRNL